MEYLGSTIEAIAVEKLAIAKPHSILVTGPLQPSVLELAEGVARDLGIEHRAFGRDYSVDARRAVGGWELDIHGAESTYPEVSIGVHGRHQTINAAVSVVAVEALLGRALDGSAVIEASAAFAAPGRMEPVATAPLVLIDGAHNADGFAVLEAALNEEFPTTRWVLVLGVMGDKDVEAMVDHVSQRVDAIVATQIASDRAVPAADLARRVAAVTDVPVEAVEDPVAAVRRAMELAGSDGAVLVAGSLYMIGQVRSAVAPGG
jgi:dihydrofolate synthase/folylpolyglutamate synthase